MNTAEISEVAEVPEIIIDSHKSKKTVIYNSGGIDQPTEVTTTTTISSLGEYTIKQESTMSMRGGRGYDSATNAKGVTIHLNGNYRFNRSVASMDEAFALAKFIDENCVNGDFTAEVCLKLHGAIMEGRIGCAKSAVEQVELLYNIVTECKYRRPCLIVSQRKRPREEE